MRLRQTERERSAYHIKGLRLVGAEGCRTEYLSGHLWHLLARLGGVRGGGACLHDTRICIRMTRMYS